MERAADHAELALLLEVAGTPKPGNVDRHRDLPDLRFEHFLVGAVGSRPGLSMAEDGAAIGPAFERAVRGMASQGGGNTQFGALLLLVPLVQAARTELSPDVADSVVEDTSVADAAAFYRAFDHVDVFVDDPPSELDDLDVRRGSDAIPRLKERELTLYEVLAGGVPGDDVAREWVTGFERSFAAADRLAATPGTVTERTAATFLALLAERPDTLVTKRRGEAVADRVSDRAATLHERSAVRTDPDAVETFADDLVQREINPGTTADLTAAGLFIALERGTLAV